jgi:hypothetical protein
VPIAKFVFEFFRASSSLQIWEPLSLSPSQVVALGCESPRLTHALAQAIEHPLRLARALRAVQALERFSSVRVQHQTGGIAAKR